MSRSILKWVWSVECAIHGARVPALVGRGMGNGLQYDHDWPHVVTLDPRGRVEWERVISFSLSELASPYDSRRPLGRCAQCFAVGPLHLVRLLPGSGRQRPCVDECVGAEGDYCRCVSCAGGCHGLSRCDPSRHPKQEVVLFSKSREAIA